eukprot:TRINITY_DN4118_c1_g1_i1.p1 TRINITY_DN4118_c1_g1~~TRINITY_DN4118_c1_g1_i1.p1  ORF type:complete len:1198 (+),score=182.55 TRINITY_DN4118_c1_g1_i1:45-3638(+)
MDPVFRYRPFELQLEANLPEDVEIPLLDQSKCVILTPNLALLLGNVDSASFDSGSILQCYLLKRISKEIVVVELPPSDPGKAPRAIEDFAVLLHEDFAYVFGGRYRNSSEEDDGETAENANATNEIKSNGLFRFSVSHIKQLSSNPDDTSSLTISWENMTPESKSSAPKPRSKCSATVMPVDKLLFFGGLSSEGMHLDDFWEFDLNLQKWRQLADKPRANAPNGTFGASMHATTSRILVCAGRSQRVVMRTFNMDLPVPSWKMSTGVNPSNREDAVLHELDDHNLLLVGGFSWRQEDAVESDADDDALDRAEELGYDDDFMDASDEEEERAGAIESLQDPLWLYSTLDHSWIPLQVNYAKYPSLKGAIIRCSAAATSSSAQGSFTVIAQSSADEPGALIWLTLKQANIRDEADYAQIDSRKIPAATPKFMFDHPIFYDICIQIGESADAAVLRLQQGVLKSSSSYFKAVTSGGWYEHIAKSESHGNVPLHLIKEGDPEAALLLLKFMFGVLSIEQIAKDHLSSILTVINEGNIFGLSDPLSKLYDAFIGYMLEENPKMLDQLVGDPFAPFFQAVEPQPIADSIMASTLRAKKWAMSLKYAERLLVVGGHRFPLNLQSIFCSLVLEQLEHYVKKYPELAIVPLTSLSTICERVTSYGDASFASMLLQPLRRLTRSIELPEGQYPLHDVSRKIVNNLCSLSTHPDIQEFFLVDCLTHATMFCQDQSRSLTQGEVQAQAESCKSLPELLSMLLSLHDESEMIFAILQSKVTTEDIFKALQLLRQWVGHVPRITQSNESLLNRVAILYAVHHIGSHGRFALPALEKEASCFIQTYLDFYCQVEVLSTGVKVLSPRLVQFLATNASSSTLAHAIRKRIALADHLSVLKLLQAGCGLLVPPKNLMGMPEMGAMINDLMRERLLPPVDAGPTDHPLRKQHTLVDRLCYELHFNFDPLLAAAVIFCSQFDATPKIFTDVAWRHALALSLILTDQVADPPPWLTHIHIGDHLMVHLIVDSCYDQPTPNMLPYEFIVAHGLKCRWVPACLWERARKLDPGYFGDEKWDFLQLAIGETMTSKVIEEQWSPQGPVYSITSPIIENPGNWREASVLYHAAECNHVDLVRRMLTLGPNVDLATKTFHKTPLWIACANDSRALVRMLLYAGADPNNRADIYINDNHDKGSRSCIEIAAERGFHEVVALLQDN